MKVELGDKIVELDHRGLNGDTWDWHTESILGCSTFEYLRKQNARVVDISNADLSK